MLMMYILYGCRETLEAYFKETENLAIKLLELMAETLRIDKKEIVEMFENGLQTTRMTYYPPCSQPELVMGLTPHSDATGITILLQVNEVEGLQVKKDGLWLPVSILPHALVVNVGDVLEVPALFIIIFIIQIHYLLVNVTTLFLNYYHFFFQHDIINCLISKNRNVSAHQKNKKKKQKCFFL